MIDEIEETLISLMPKGAHPLFHSAQYSLEGGKRLRPLLTLTVVRTFGRAIQHALIPACALEMIHTYSLIHDDLPCMDDDDYRRNKLSLHKAVSENRAVLTGDLLLTHAFEILADAPGLGNEVKMKLISTLSKRAGLSGIIGGQFLDLETSNQTEELLEEMHCKKTGALITAALEFGGILAEQDGDLWSQLGHHLGLAFQYVDDQIDKDGSYALLGEKRTQELVDAHYNAALRLLETLPQKGTLLEEIAQSMVVRSQ